MPELDYDYTLHTTNKGDENLFVEIYVGELKNDEKSLEEGRPIYDQVEMIRITVPGDRNNVVDRPLRPEDKSRFPRHYAAFKNNVAALVQGTPIALWRDGSKALAQELAFFNIHTVEQLAAAPDGNVSKISGLINLKQKAIEFVNEAKAPDGKITALQEQNESLQAQLEELKKQIAALAPKPEAAVAPVAKAPAQAATNQAAKKTAE